MATTETTVFSPPKKRECKTLWAVRWEADIDSYREYYEGGGLAYEETPEGVEREWYEDGTPQYENTPKYLARWFDDGTPHWFVRHDTGAAAEWQYTGETIYAEGVLEEPQRCKELARERFQAMKEHGQRMKEEAQK